MDNQLDDTVLSFNSEGSINSKMNYSFSQRYKSAYIK